MSLRAIIGPSDAEGEESFDFSVCSPEWLAEQLENRPFVTGRFLLIARTFVYGVVEAYVQNQIAQASGDNWNDVAQKLARPFCWEFEDYRA